MSNQNDPLRPAFERKLALSNLIRHTMVTAAEREEQRSKLVSVLILAQFLVTAMTTAGYIGSPTMIPSMLLGVVALVIYGCAYLTNRLFHRSGAASYILVIGGGTGYCRTGSSARPREPANASGSGLAALCRNYS